MSSLPSLVPSLPSWFPIRIVKQNTSVLFFSKTFMHYVLQNAHVFCKTWFTPKTGHTRHFLRNSQPHWFRSTKAHKGECDLSEKGIQFPHLRSISSLSGICTKSGPASFIFFNNLYALIWNETINFLISMPWNKFTCPMETKTPM